MNYETDYEPEILKVTKKDFKENFEIYDKVKKLYIHKDTDNIYYVEIKWRSVEIGLVGNKKAIEKLKEKTNDFVDRIIKENKENN